MVPILLHNLLSAAATCVSQTVFCRGQHGHCETMLRAPTAQQVFATPQAWRRRGACSVRAAVAAPPAGKAATKQVQLGDSDLQVSGAAPL